MCEIRLRAGKIGGEQGGREGGMGEAGRRGRMCVLGGNKGGGGGEDRGSEVRVGRDTRGR